MKRLNFELTFFKIDIKVLNLQNCFLSLRFYGGDFMEIADNVRKKSWFLVINKKSGAIYNQPQFFTICDYLFFLLGV